MLESTFEYLPLPCLFFPPFLRLSLLVFLQGRVSLDSASVTRRKLTSASRTARASSPGESPRHRRRRGLSIRIRDGPAPVACFGAKISRKSSNAFVVQLPHSIEMSSEVAVCWVDDTTSWRMWFMSAASLPYNAFFVHGYST